MEELDFFFLNFTLHWAEKFVFFCGPMDKIFLSKWILIRVALIVIFPKVLTFFLILTKFCNTLGEFLNFLGFSKIFRDCLVFSFAFLNFLDFSRIL